MVSTLEKRSDKVEHDIFWVGVAKSLLPTSSFSTMSLGVSHLFDCMLLHTVTFLLKMVMYYSMMTLPVRPSGLSRLTCYPRFTRSEPNVSLGRFSVAEQRSARGF